MMIDTGAHDLLNHLGEEIGAVRRHGILITPRALVHDGPLKQAGINYERLTSLFSRVAGYPDPVIRPFGYVRNAESAWAYYTMTDERLRTYFRGNFERTLPAEILDTFDFSRRLVNTHRFKFIGNVPEDVAALARQLRWV